MKKSFIKTSSFKEHLVKRSDSPDLHRFDIVALPGEAADFRSKAKFSMSQYCNTLLQKLFDLEKFLVKAFVKYHCTQVNEPLIWLNSLEELIILNLDFELSEKQHVNAQEALKIIVELQEQFSRSQHRPYSRQNLNAFKTIEEKVAYLLKLKDSQKTLEIDLSNELSFNDKIERELVFLKSILAIALKNKNDFNKNTGNVPAKQYQFKLNINTNRFVNVFYEMMYEKEIDGKPFLEAKASELAEFITYNFIDKNGKTIPVNTVKTILKPSRIEKRPKGFSDFFLN